MRIDVRLTINVEPYLLYTTLDGQEYAVITSNNRHVVCQRMPDGWQSLGSGMNGNVLALAVYNGKLIAGGGFTTAGSGIADCIAQWDGTKWSSLGSGMNNSVSALAVYNGELVAGGHFAFAGGVLAYFIAKWNGTNWSSLGKGMSRCVRALTVTDGELIAEGDFSAPGNKPSKKDMAKWDGKEWVPVDQ